jgi:hypothetical protein
MWAGRDLLELIADLHLDEQFALYRTTYHDNGSVISLDSSGSEARRILERLSL